MKIRKTIIILCSSLLLMSGCDGCKSKSSIDEKKRENVNLNIIITPDLSNRVEANRYPKPVSDIALIRSVFDNYYPNLYEYNHRINGQKDALNLAFTNANIITEYKYKGLYSIDIAKKEDENRLYLKTFDSTETQFHKESRSFVNDIEELYRKASIKPAGADIISFFKNRINTVLKKNINSKIKNYSIDTKFRNIIVLFTDGYIEAGLYGERNCLENKCYFLDGYVINKFRKDFKKNGKGMDLKSFFYKKNYGIIPVKNKELKNVEIFVCELYDRSLNRRTGSRTVIPSDFDIMKIFWADWLEKSGFKKFKLVEKVSNVDEFQASFMSFLNE